MSVSVADHGQDTGGTAPPGERGPASPARPVDPGRGGELGRLGEDVAARHLAGQGLIELSRNWRCREGELDLVLTDGRRLVVVEVKTRTTAEFGSPAAHVTQAKARRVRHAAQAWLRRYHVGWVQVRFDVVAVVWPSDGPPEVTHLRDVF